MAELEKKKMVIGLRPEDWLASDIEKYMAVHSVNKTDAVHGIIRDLKLKNVLAEKHIKDLTGTSRDFQRLPETSKAAEPPKNFNPPSMTPANLIECVYAGADHKTKMMLHKRWCDACALNPQTPEMPCPKRRPANERQPTTSEIDAALAGEKVKIYNTQPLPVQTAEKWGNWE